MPYDAAPSLIASYKAASKAAKASYVGATISFLAEVTTISGSAGYYTRLRGARQELVSQESTRAEGGCFTEEEARRLVEPLALRPADWWHERHYSLCTQLASCAYYFSFYNILL